jgi:phosphate:Na+ symporter
MDWLQMSTGLFGGLALFLFGMEQMADALKAASGEKIKTILARLTSNRFTAAVTGALVTAVLQSSSVTTVLVVGFISAGLMSLAQSVGIIMGANVGTTITAQIVAFKITKAALVMIAIGFGMLFLAKQDRTRHLGGMVMGIGLIFFGMSIMSESMEPLRTSPAFLDTMAAMEKPLLGILVAAIFTALIQSSSATTGIVVVMASQGFVSLPAGIALALGANIGTCVTALLASIGKPREALRASLVHVLFNVFGVVLWMGFINELAQFSAWLSPSYPGLSGFEKLSAETPRQIANANTAFNVINTLIFIGFTGVFAAVATRMVPDLPRPVEPVIVRPKFLDAELVATPSLALGRVRMEFGHLGELVKSMLGKVKPGFLQQDRQHLEAIAKMDDQVDLLYAQVIEYLGEIRKQSLTDAENAEFLKLVSATDNLERIGDMVETNIMRLGYRIQEKNLHISDSMKAALNDLMATAYEAVNRAIVAVESEDQVAAQDVLAVKPVIEQKISAVLEHQARKLAEADAQRLELFRAEMEMTETVKHIYTLARRIARTVLPAVLQTETA